MRLTALNHQWAVYQGPTDVNEPFDAKGVLRDLIQVKNYQQLINFLANDAACSAFTQPRAISYLQEPLASTRVWAGHAEDIELSGDLANAVTRHDDLDLLDDLVCRELDQDTCRATDLPLLIDVRDRLVKFLTLAGVALGSPAPSSLFREVPTSSVLEMEWLTRLIGPCASQFRTLSLPFAATGVDEVGPWLANDLQVGQGIFSHLEKYSPYQLVIDQSKKDGFAAYTDGYPFSVDRVIYTAVQDEPYSTPLALTVTFGPNVSVERAQSLLAGRVTECLVNGEMVFRDEYRSPYDYEDYASRAQYVYTIGEGFTPNPVRPPIWYIETLFREARQLVLQGDVALCSVCGAPFIPKTRRARKDNLVCSDSCKTKASNQRRDKAMAFALSGAPVEEAITAIGQEYEKSIRKWYAQAEQLRPRS